MSTKELAQKYSLIGVEDLDLQEMKETYGRKVSDLSFYNFVQYLDYKSKMYGSKLLKVNRYFPSSQICSNCGYQNSEVSTDLDIREWVCPKCGTKHDRDINASKNILKEVERVYVESLAKAAKKSSAS